MTQVKLVDQIKAARNRALDADPLDVKEYDAAFAELAALRAKAKNPNYDEFGNWVGLSGQRKRVDAMTLYYVSVNGKPARETEGKAVDETTMKLAVMDIQLDWMRAGHYNLVTVHIDYHGDTTSFVVMGDGLTALGIIEVKTVRQKP